MKALLWSLIIIAFTFELAQLIIFGLETVKVNEKYVKFMKNNLDSDKNNLISNYSYKIVDSIYLCKISSSKQGKTKFKNPSKIIEYLSNNSRRIRYMYLCAYWLLWLTFIIIFIIGVLVLLFICPEINSMSGTFLSSTFYSILFIFGFIQTWKVHLYFLGGLSQSAFIILDFGDCMSSPNPDVEELLPQLGKITMTQLLLGFGLGILYILRVTPLSSPFMGMSRPITASRDRAKVIYCASLILELIFLVDYTGRIPYFHKLNYTFPDITYILLLILIYTSYSARTAIFWGQQLYIGWLIRSSIFNDPFQDTQSEYEMEFNRLFGLETKIEDLELMEDERDLVCSICLSALYGDAQITRIKACQHIYHLKCLREWVAIKPSCPVCRRVLF